jgi:hypothetical protein
MQNFTQEPLTPNASTILFLKQFARMCNTKKNEKHGYHSFSVVACC